MNVEQIQVAGSLWSTSAVSALVGLFAGFGLVFVVFGSGGLQLGGVIAVSILTVLWIVWLYQGFQRGVSRPGRLVWANTLGFAVGVTLGFALFIGFFFVAQVRPIIEFEEGLLVLIHEDLRGLAPLR